MNKIFTAICGAFVAAACIPCGAFAASTEMVLSPVSDNNVGAVNTAGYNVEVIRLVNKERTSRGMTELKLIPKLNRAAEIRAKEIARSFSHTRPDGRSSLTACEDEGLEWSAFGENIAMGYTSPKAVVDGWMNSADHRKNILNEQYRYLGVGVVESGGSLYWSQAFYSTYVTVTDSYTVNEYGDVNRDGKADAVDASMVLAEYAAVTAHRSSTLNQAQKARGDLNGDSKLDSVDASQILAYYAKNSTR